MLRTLTFALVLGLPSLASAEQFPRAASEQVVRGHDGAELGRIAGVEYDENGDIVAAEIPGLEPGDAPYASSDIMAQERLRVPARAQSSQRANSARLQEAASGGRFIRVR